MPTLSVIITTYNWEKALEAALKALLAQAPLPLEILVADDGSRPSTQATIKAIEQHSPCPIVHIWHPDEGFQAAKIRNRAIAQAKGDYLVFLDGDCVVLPGFLKRHLALAEKGWFVAGNRMLLTQSFTEQVLAQQLPIHQYTAMRWMQIRWSGGSNRWCPMLLFPGRRWRKCWAKRWKGAKTCNLGAWREDMLRINGFDEAFEGWGYEDSDAIIRLQRVGIQRKEGRFGVSVAHLWHQEQPRDQAQRNWQRFLKACQATQAVAKQGVQQYLETV